MEELNVPKKFLVIFEYTVIRKFNKTKNVAQAFNDCVLFLVLLKQEQEKYDMSKKENEARLIEGNDNNTSKFWPFIKVFLFIVSVLIIFIGTQYEYTTSFEQYPALTTTISNSVVEELSNNPPEFPITYMSNVNPFYPLQCFPESIEITEGPFLTQTDSDEIIIINNIRKKLSIFFKSFLSASQDIVNKKLTVVTKTFEGIRFIEVETVNLPFENNTVVFSEGALSFIQNFYNSIGIPEWNKVVQYTLESLPSSSRNNLLSLGSVQPDDVSTIVENFLESVGMKEITKDPETGNFSFQLPMEVTTSIPKEFSNYSDKFFMELDLFVDTNVSTRAVYVKSVLIKTTFQKVKGKNMFTINLGDNYKLNDFFPSTLSDFYQFGFWNHLKEKTAAYFNTHDKVLKKLFRIKPSSKSSDETELIQPSAQEVTETKSTSSSQPESKSSNEPKETEVKDQPLVEKSAESKPLQSGVQLEKQKISTVEAELDKMLYTGKNALGAAAVALGMMSIAYLMRHTKKNKRTILSEEERKVLIQRIKPFFVIPEVSKGSVNEQIESRKQYLQSQNLSYTGFYKEAVARHFWQKKINMALVEITLTFPRSGQIDRKEKYTKDVTQKLVKDFLSFSSSHIFANKESIEFYEKFSPILFAEQLETFESISMEIIVYFLIFGLKKELLTAIFFEETQVVGNFKTFYLETKTEKKLLLAKLDEIIAKLSLNQLKTVENENHIVCFAETEHLINKLSFQY